MTHDRIEEIRTALKRSPMGYTRDRAFVATNEIRESLMILACLGNGDRFGNSAGNVIAIRALGLDPAEVHNQKP